jgi:hypothetical protein
MHQIPPQITTAYHYNPLYTLRKNLHYFTKKSTLTFAHLVNHLFLLLIYKLHKLLQKKPYQNKLVRPSQKRNVKKILSIR